ncbi:MAG: hypothetical protein E7401_03185 [Ruminococcaceae bacterium]|nr:hypothetical protein [Oscillospiraceae bacterium]
MVDIKLLINALVTKTKDTSGNENLKWCNLRQYLESEKNEALRKYVVFSSKNYYNRSSFYTKDVDFLNEFSSYVVDVNNGTIIVLTYQCENSMYHILCAQTTKTSRVVELNLRQEYQTDLKSLINTIRDDVDNIDKFLGDIIG